MPCDMRASLIYPNMCAACLESGFQQYRVLFAYIFCDQLGRDVDCTLNEYPVLVLLPNPAPHAVEALRSARLIVGAAADQNNRILTRYRTRRLRPRSHFRVGS